MSQSDFRERYKSWITRIREHAESVSSADSTDVPIQIGQGAEAHAAGPSAGGQPIAAREERSAVSEPYRVLAARLEGLWKQPHFQKIAVTSTLPGEGKTVTSVNVAYVLARDFGRKVLLIDGDLRKPGLWRFHAEKPSSGLTDLLASRQSPESVIRPLHHEQLSLLEAGQTRVNPTRLWKSGAIKHLFAYLETHYDYLIVDTSPVLTGVETTLVADLVDGVAVVVRGV